MIRTGIFLIGLLVALPAWGQKDIAVSTKTQGEVRLKRVDAEDFNVDLEIGTNIQNQDNIRTGEDGFGVVVFLDDKSQLKIQSNSEVEIQGKSASDARAMAKEIRLGTGKLKAEISEQREGEFVVATPTSVAAVKGTVFWILVNPASGDRLVVESGSVLLTNRSTGDSVIVGENETGRSSQQGDLGVAANLKIRGEVRGFSPNTSLTLSNVSIISGETPEGVSIEGTEAFTVSLDQFSTIEGENPSNGDQVTVTGELHSDGEFLAYVIGVSGKVRELEIPFENEDGERKTLKIRYK